MAAQQRDEDAAGAAFEATLSESESELGSESDSEKELGVETMEKYGPQGGHSPAVKLPSEELRQNREEFRALMEVVSASCTLAVPISTEARCLWE